MGGERGIVLKRAGWTGDADIADVEIVKKVEAAYAS
jgi:hypothetical protein